MGHPASTFYAASLQFLLPQAASTWHFRYSDVVFSSPDKEKHVLPYPECFSRDHFPSLSLSPHCCLHQFSSHTFASNISLLSLVSMLPSLILTLSIISHFATEISIPASNQPGKPSTITQLSDLPTSIFMLSYCYCLPPSFYFFFVCKLLSTTFIRPDICHAKCIMLLSSLSSPMHHL